MMTPMLYDQLVPFYHLLDPLEDHADEVKEFGSVLKRAVPQGQALLELGAGAGHGAHYIKNLFERVVLTDISDVMMSRSRTLNPECEHRLGDMRTLRLNETFDCVLIHDAIAYLTSKPDLVAAIQTALAHLKPGGAALFIPDCVKETYRETWEDHVGDDDERSLRCISWSYDPDPGDDTHIVDFAFLLRENGEVRAVHDRHHLGLFTTDDWVQICREVGFDVDIVRRPLPDGYEESGYTENMFLCRKIRF